MKVIIVDDDRGNLNAFRTSLSRKGFQVEVCDRGDEALSRINALFKMGAPPDVVVTDQRMPVMTGADLISALKDSWPDLPVVLMTAYGSKRLEEFAARMSADYLEKPFAPERLIEVIGHIHNTKRRAGLC
ncbi:MAG: response regulator [Pseudomonadota bacterium]